MARLSVLNNAMFLWCIFILLLNYSCLGINATAIEDQDEDLNFQNHKIRISYTLWTSTDEYCLNLKVAPNTSFYHVMEYASRLDPTFNFKATDYPGMGHFITEIAGVANNETTSTYWMIYILSKKPNKDSPPTDKDLSLVGVDSIEVQKHKHYLFWYKHVQLV